MAAAGRDFHFASIRMEKFNLLHENKTLSKQKYINCSFDFF